MPEKVRSTKLKFKGEKTKKKRKERSDKGQKRSARANTKNQEALNIIAFTPPSYYTTYGIYGFAPRCLTNRLQRVVHSMSLHHSHYWTSTARPSMRASMEVDRAPIHTREHSNCAR